MNIVKIISSETQISEKQINATVQLLNEGCTIPFISRYRKEYTGSLDEVQIQTIKERKEQLEEVDKRRDAILKSMEELGFLTPELKNQLENAITLTELEDIYLPYKPKRKTRATAAKEKGLEPLAMVIMKQDSNDVESIALHYVNDEKGVASIEDALQGARDIIAEWMNENQVVRSKVRNLFHREAHISSKVVKVKEKEAEKYQNYFAWDEQLNRAPSHRILALFRGENEGLLRLQIGPSEEKAVEIIERNFIKSRNQCAQQLEIAAKDCYKRLLSPSIETEMRSEYKAKADLEAIRVFTSNLRQLLLASPLGQKNVLALDPGYKSGCKLVCLDAQGNLVHNETIYPHAPQNEKSKAMSKITSLVSAYKIEAIAIGNGTASRETEDMIKHIHFNKDIQVFVVSESGASIYSASSLAREEFPQFDVTVRGAVSIGRRLMDPLAELVKIDAKSIGVGQYQHDVDQNSLQKSLDVVVESCVNSVGVEVNTASKQLLAYISGLGPALAQNIVDHRKTNGPFESRNELKKVARLGSKAYEQCAGFLRIRGAENLLDNSAVHPERYALVNKMAKDLKCNLSDLINNNELLCKIEPTKYVSEDCGLPTIQDILKELAKPGRDPRSKIEIFEFDKSLRNIEDVRAGMLVPGIVTNITAFGCFVDIGIKENGLIHVSEMADEFISDPSTIVSMHQQLMVKIIDVDTIRKRIALTLKGVKN
ncbi:MAG: Tex family protein [Bacteroidota bacterium]